MSAVSEIVTNGVSHGRPPVRLRVWADMDHMIVTVHDPGPGPDDPLAGLIPAAHHGRAGYGLWLAHQLCTHVALHHDHNGFTVRLTAGNPKS
jgi:anti-sigma regulatory factor (Ser/Thr protein kinase)